MTEKLNISNHSRRAGKHQPLRIILEVNAFNKSGLASKDLNLSWLSDKLSFTNLISRTTQ